MSRGIRILVGMIALSAVACASSSQYMLNAYDSVKKDNVNVGADFTIDSFGTLTVTLNNYFSDPTKDGQVLTGIRFTLAAMDGQANLSSSSGDLINIQSSGSVSDVGIGTLSSWSASTSLDQVTLSMISSSHARQGIVGDAGADGKYVKSSDMSGSSHNSYVDGAATFVFQNVPGLTVGSVVSAVQFGFGTSSQHYMNASSSTGDLVAVSDIATPEPASWTLCLLAGCALAVMASRRIGTLPTPVFRS